jgi:hypothetical protein
MSAEGRWVAMTGITPAARAGDDVPGEVLEGVLVLLATDSGGEVRNFVHDQHDQPLPRTRSQLPAPVAGIEQRGVPGVHDRLAVRQSIASSREGPTKRAAHVRQGPSSTCLPSIKIKSQSGDIAA